MYEEVVDEDYGIFIDIEEEILKYISQEEIFQLITGELPLEYELITSPLRIDSNPGCWFEYNINGILEFRDFGQGDRPLDCFAFIKQGYHLPSYYDSMYFVKRYIRNHINKAIYIVEGKTSKVKLPSIILTKYRVFNNKDKAYWLQYGITKTNLVEDKVYPVDKFRIINSKGDRVYLCYELTYAYTNFKDRRKKLYTPYSSKKKFITNCIANDIGGTPLLPSNGTLVITKSYKDYRVLKNLSIDTRWFQNEGQIPKDKDLITLLSGYKEVVLFFDNDSTGFEASEKVLKKVESLFTIDIRRIFIPNGDPRIKDASDYYLYRGKMELIYFLKDKQLL